MVEKEIDDIRKQEEEDEMKEEMRAGAMAAENGVQVQQGVQSHIAGT